MWQNGEEFSPFFSDISQLYRLTLAVLKAISSRLKTISTILMMVFVAFYTRFSAA